MKVYFLNKILPRSVVLVLARQCAIKEGILDMAKFYDLFNGDISRDELISKFRGSDKFIVVLPLTSELSIGILKQKRILNPNAVAFIYKDINPYSYDPLDIDKVELALENSDEIVSVLGD